MSDGGGGSCVEVRTQFLFFEIHGSLILFYHFGAQFFLRTQYFFITAGKYEKDKK